ncbi:sensor histidine kinase [Spirillospora sp. NBC_01491]|uniref:sensor histidine kinase n=1 Tax=Spirillospora sp. NBC_01491 TaxID=2976007 RepID=UPI002E357F3D|nr:ATP-binding protein [Spirillospora sp. NBC_01491]
MTPSASPTPSPGGRALRLATPPLAACVAGFVIAAPLLPRDMGPGAWALAFAADAAALAVLAATVLLHVRHRAKLAAIARCHWRLDRQAADLRDRHHREVEREQAWQAHSADLSARCAAATAMVEHLVNAQLPAALAGRPVPPPPGAAPAGEDALDARLEGLRDTALDDAARVRHGHQDEMESQRLTLVALSRRVQSAMHRVQAEAATTAERHRDLPEVYGGCQVVDHLAAQAARLAQGLAVACGTWEGQQWDTPMRLAEVVQAAQARIEDYQRVGVEGDPDVGIVPVALESVIHLLAELLANATESSPTATTVQVRVAASGQGAVFRIDDHGAGLEEPRLSQARELLNGTREVGLADMGEVPRLGLPVVARYVLRHGFKVTLDESPYGGLQVIVLVPEESVTAVETPGSTATSSAGPPAPTPERGPVPVPAAGEVDGLPQRVSRRNRDTGAAAEPSAPPGVAPPPETPEEAGALMGALLEGTTAPAPRPPADDADGRWRSFPDQDDSNRQERLP